MSREATPATSLGKGYLVAKLRALLQAQRLHIPRTESARRLAEELRDFELPTQPDASERYGAFRVGAQDDLVTAVGLAVQAEPKISVYGNVYYGW